MAAEDIKRTAEKTGEEIRHNFQRNIATELRIGRAIHLTHATLAEGSIQRVATSHGLHAHSPL